MPTMQAVGVTLNDKLNNRSHLCIMASEPLPYHSLIFMNILSMGYAF